MHVFLMVIVLLTQEGGHIQGHPYSTLAACEKAKADITAQAIAAGIVDFGVSCTDVEVGKHS